MSTRRFFTGILRLTIGAGLFYPTLGVTQTLTAERAAESPFAWTIDFDAAKASSLRTGKPVLLVIDAPQQRWDRYIERTVLPDSALAQVVRRFVWVLPDPARSQELGTRFHVAGLPTLLLLGPDEENVHRRTGYLTPKALSDFLREGLRRHELFARGLDWDLPEPRGDRLSAKYDFATLPAPSSEFPQGIAFIGDTLFVKQGPTVFKLDESTGEILGSFPLPGLVTDLASDGEFLYAVDYCWTSGQPIYVVDPEDGEVVRTVVTRANSTRKECAVSGVEILAGRLRVLELTGKIHEVEPESGNIEATLDVEGGLSGLAFDGEDLVSVSAKGIVFLDPASGHLRRMVSTNYQLRSIGFHAGHFFLMEQPLEGFDRNHDRIRISPKVTMLYVGAL